MGSITSLRTHIAAGTRLQDIGREAAVHNETAYAIQRRLQWRGLATVVLPIRVRE